MSVLLFSIPPEILVYIFEFVIDPNCQRFPSPHGASKAKELSYMLCFLFDLPNQDIAVTPVCYSLQ